MRRSCFLFSFLALGSLVVMGQEQKKDENRRITADELKEMVKESYFFLDVREAAEIEELGTIKGYVNIPVTQLEQRLSEVPKDKTIVTL
ncbi:MAG: hypothetical protein K2Q23_07970 [Bryobacteraceae bacterium]|nr:hypothetical protein [Bryobacteraceae bacterium]